MREVIGTPVTWRDILIERLKSGRGSAIKAQTRGKLLEMQNRGQITRIYTSQMFPELRQDLLRLRSEHGLDPKP
jgi:hypothetical protein